MFDRLPEDISTDELKALVQEQVDFLKHNHIAIVKAEVIELHGHPMVAVHYAFPFPSMN